MFEFWYLTAMNVLIFLPLLLHQHKGDNVPPALIMLYFGEVLSIIVRTPTLLLDAIPRKPRSVVRGLFVVLIASFGFGWMYIEILGNETPGEIKPIDLCLWTCTDSFKIRNTARFTLLVFYLKFLGVSFMRRHRLLIFATHIELTSELNMSGLSNRAGEVAKTSKPVGSNHVFVDPKETDIELETKWEKDSDSLIPSPRYGSGQMSQDFEYQTSESDERGNHSYSPTPSLEGGGSGQMSRDFEYQTSESDDYPDLPELEKNDDLPDLEYEPASNRLDAYTLSDPSRSFRAYNIKMQGLLTDELRMEYTPLVSNHTLQRICRHKIFQNVVILIGLTWFLIYIYTTSMWHLPSLKETRISLEATHSIELSFCLLAAVLSWFWYIIRLDKILVIELVKMFELWYLMFMNVLIFATTLLHQYEGGLKNPLVATYIYSSFILMLIRTLSLLLDTIPHKRCIFTRVILVVAWATFVYMCMYGNQTNSVLTLPLAKARPICVWVCSDTFKIQNTSVFTLLVFYSRFLVVSFWKPSRLLILKMKIDLTPR